jgi:hypothetical protein
MTLQQAQALVDQLHRGFKVIVHDFSHDKGGEITPAGWRPDGIIGIYPPALQAMDTRVARWTIAHEVGHGILGHHANPALLPPAEQVQREINADTWGVQALIRLGYEVPTWEAVHQWIMEDFQTHGLSLLVERDWEVEWKDRIENLKKILPHDAKKERAA